MKPWVTRRLTGPLHDWRRCGGEIARAAAELVATDRASAEELAALSERRLDALLAHATAHAPHYCNAGRELTAMPLLTRDDLRAADLIARDRPRRTRRHRTSGSTGRPTTATVDVSAYARHTAARQRAHGWLGKRPGERWAAVWGQDAPRSFLRRLADELADNRRVLAIADLDGDRAKNALRELARFEPVLIYGFASALVRMAQLEPRLPSLRAVVSTAEMLPDAEVKRLRDVFGVPVGFEYGLAECQFIAGSCEAGSMHVAEENVLVEILRDGRPVAPGETGDLVVTDFFSSAAPLIRYSTGDVGAWVDEPCACGRAHRRMALRVARSCEMFQLDGHWFHPEVFTLPHDFPHFDRVRHLRALRLADREFVVEVALDGADDAPLAALERAYRAALPVDDLALTVRRVDSIPRDPSGKRRYFLDKR